MRDTEFLSMDLGSNPPTSVPVEDIEVVVDCGQLVGDYAHAFIREAQRINSSLADQVALTEDELMEYFKFILTRRVQFVHGDCPDFRRLKVLYIPSYFQFVISMIGNVMDREYGLRLVPVMEEESTMTLTDAITISEKIGSFERCLQVVQDAMPRSDKGDKNVMSTALLAGYVRAYRKVEHPAATYVTAFLNMTLRREAAFQALYRIQYDDVAFIQSALTAEKGLFV